MCVFVSTVFPTSPSPHSLEIKSNNSCTNVYFATFRVQVFKFLEANKLDLIIRAGEWTPDGFKYVSNRTVLNLFSTRNFCDKRNPAAMVKIDKRGKVDIILCSEEVEFADKQLTSARSGRPKRVSKLKK